MINLKKEICFLSENDIYHSDSDAHKDLILSPYYYWYFEKKLPISDLKKARKMLPQMIASSLPEKEFEFVVIQNKDDKKTFKIFALDLELVKEKLSSFNFESVKITNLAFSHLEFEDGNIELQDSILVKSENSACEVKKTQLTLEGRSRTIEEVITNKDKLFYKYRFGKSNSIYKAVEFLENNFLALVFICILFLSASFIYSLVHGQLGVFITISTWIKFSLRC